MTSASAARGSKTSTLPTLFHDINLRNARLDDVNLSGVEINNANLAGTKINGILVTDLLAAHARAG